MKPSPNDSINTAREGAESSNAPNTSDRDQQEAAQNNARYGRMWTKTARIAGGVFAAAGAFKLLAPSQPGFAGGGRGFGHALQTLHVPFSAFFGYAIPLLELVGGTVLCGSWLFSRRLKRRDHATRRDEAMAQRIEAIERALCVLLACDMFAAIAFVGVPGALGHPLRVGNMEIGNEKWRLPLELALLWIMVQRSRKGPA